jgi:hypothetical protein
VRRGPSVLRHHNHRVCRHHNHHRRQARRRNSTWGRSPPGAPAAATTATAAAEAAVVPLPGSLEGPGPQVSGVHFSLISLFNMPIGLNPSFACQGFLSLSSQGRASPAPGCCRRDRATVPPGSRWGSGSSGANAKRCRSGGGGPHCSDGCHSLNDGDVVEYTIGSGRGGPNYARPRHRGQRGGRVQLRPVAHSGGDGGDFWAAAPVRRRARSGAGSPPPVVVLRPSGPPRDRGGDPVGVRGT